MSRPLNSPEFSLNHRSKAESEAIARRIAEQNSAANEQRRAARHHVEERAIANRCKDPLFP